MKYYLNKLSNEDDKSWNKNLILYKYYTSLEEYEKAEKNYVKALAELKKFQKKNPNQILEKK